MYDDNDWGISDTLFCYLKTNWGPHTIDRFANYLNTKLPRFNSRYWNPGSESIDSFICDWEHENNYLCPPIPLIPRVLRPGETDQHCLPDIRHFQLPVFACSFRHHQFLQAFHVWQAKFARRQAKMFLI